MHQPHPWRGFREWKRHSIVLLVAGLVYIVLGVSYIVIPLIPSNERGMHLALVWAPIWFWGSLFVLAGCLAILSSRWPPVSETWGYTVLTGLSCGWAAVYAAGLVFFNAPHTNLRGVLSFGLLGFLWWGISGLLNPGDNESLVAKNVALKHEVANLRAQNDALHQRMQGLTRQER